MRGGFDSPLDRPPGDDGDVGDLALIGEVASRLLEAPRPHDLLDDLHRQLSLHLNLEVHLYYLYDPDRRELRLESSGGLNAATLAAVRQLALGEGVCGAVAKHREPIVAEHIQATADAHAESIRELGLRAYWCHPLLAGDRLIGTLGFSTRTRPTFTARELRLMRVISHLITTSLQRASAEEQRERLLGHERRARLDAQDALTTVKQLNESLEERVAQRTQELVRHRAQLRSLVSQLVLTEQRERRRLASQLHDQIAQLLVASKMKLGLVRDQVGDDRSARDVLAEVDGFLEQSLNYTRTLIAQISPIILYERGLVDAIRWLAHTLLPTHGLRIDIHDDGVSDRLDDDLRIMLFETVRELLFNIVEHARVDHATVTLRQDGEGLELAVIDEGVGFDPHAVGRPTASLAGFGLFGIQERMVLLGGRFEVTSSPGGGTRACVWMPLLPADPEASVTEGLAEAAVSLAGPPRPTPRSAAGDGGGDVRVLVVDDHAVVREGLLMMLNRVKGFVVVGEAPDGQAAIELARQLHPQVVLMDVSMPGLDGVQATRQITDEGHGIRIIGLSMYDDAGVAASMRAAGAAAYLCKGCSVDVLTDTIRQVVQQGSRGDVECD